MLSRYGVFVDDTSFLKYSSKNELRFDVGEDGVDDGGTFVVEDAGDECSLGVVVDRLLRNELLLVVSSSISPRISSSSSSVLFSDESSFGWTVVDEL